MKTQEIAIIVLTLENIDEINETLLERPAHEQVSTRHHQPGRQQQGGKNLD